MKDPTEPYTLADRPLSWLESQRRHYEGKVDGFRIAASCMRDQAIHLELSAKEASVILHEITDEIARRASEPMPDPSAPLDPVLPERA